MLYAELLINLQMNLLSTEEVLVLVCVCVYKKGISPIISTISVYTAHVTCTCVCGRIHADMSNVCQKHN